MQQARAAVCVPAAVCVRAAVCVPGSKQTAADHDHCISCLAVDFYPADCAAGGRGLGAALFQHSAVHCSRPRGAVCNCCRGYPPRLTMKTRFVLTWLEASARLTRWAAPLPGNCTIDK